VPTYTIPTYNGLACSVDAGAITWNNAYRSKYWVYKSIDDGATYRWIGRTLGSTSFVDDAPTLGARYQVHYAGIPRVECTIDAEPGVTFPLIVEAENYLRAHDSDPGNRGLARQFAGSVDIWPKPTEEGFVVGRIRDGESTTYLVSIPSAGSYRFAVSTASGVNGGTLTLRANGQKIGPTVALVGTGGWWNFADTTIGDINLSAGTYRITAQWGSGQSNFDSFTVTQH